MSRGGYRIQACVLVCPKCGYREKKRTRIYRAGYEIKPSYDAPQVCRECRDIRSGRLEGHSLLHTLYLSVLKEEGYEVHPSGSPEFWERLYSTFS